jgi:NAD(P)-dependent dehydrogenase (short-subunit alcohol dehydrogenase family)
VADPAADAALDLLPDPLLLDRLRDALGETLENPGLAYTWAKRGVRRFVQREAIWFGRRGARICSVSPSIIDTTPRAARKPRRTRPWTGSSPRRRSAVAVWPKRWPP